MDSATVMVSLWRKYKKASRRKRQALHSLIAGLVLFGVFYLFSQYISVPLCPINRIFGRQCFGCGLTRGFMNILKLDFATATQHHILSVPLFAGIMLYSVGCVTDIVFERNDIERIEKFCMKKSMLIILALVLIISAFLNRLI